MIVTNAFVTVVTGTAVYVSGQMISKFLIDPVYELRRMIRKSHDTFAFHANIYSNWAVPDSFHADTVKATSQALRMASVSLSVAMGGVLCYRFWACFGLLPGQDRIKQAAKDLIYLSNSHGLGADEGRAIREAGQRVEANLLL